MNSNKSSIVGMTGSYNTNSTMQFSLIQSSIPFLKQAIELLDIDSSLSSPIILADFGCAHGSNSVYIMKLIIDLIKEIKKTKRSFLVIHNDLPTNNWNTLFDIVNNQDDTYFGLGNGQSFYNQCLPSNSLTLGYSSTSIQWLSKKPCNISEHCHPFYAKKEEIEAFKSQARDDYKNFLKNRSSELISGGIFIIGIVSVNDQGENGFEDAFDVLYECAKLLPLNNEQLLNLTFANYLRSSSECFEVQIYHQLINQEITIEEFAKNLTDFIRCGTESTLKEALQINSNDEL